jgi:hypothetical protein
MTHAKLVKVLALSLLIAVLAAYAAIGILSVPQDCSRAPNLPACDFP